MRRSVLLVVLLAVLPCLAATVSAQPRATQMFAETSHDFGAVARGAVATHLFWFSNPFDADIHVRSVRTTCGCTTPSIPVSLVKRGERGAILATLNTRAFTGQRSATITVVFDQPRYAEVQLQVRAYIRSDVVFRPGGVDFGTIREGQSAQQIIGVDYAGRSDWRIESVLSSAPYLRVQTREVSRRASRVAYELVVQLGTDAPPGKIDTALVVHTNDRTAGCVPLAVSGEVVPPLSVNPALLYVGNVAQGRETKSRLVVRAAEAFRVLTVECEDPRFAFEFSDESKPLHFISVTFRASGEANPVSTSLRITTDLAGAGPAHVTASGAVVP